MSKRIRKTICLALFCLYAALLCGCSSEQQQTEDLPITAKWSFYYMTLPDGDHATARINDPLEKAPGFHASDGKNFTISGGGLEEPVPGTMTQNDDGTYTLDYGMETYPIATISGDVLKLTFANGVEIVFLGD